MTPAPKSRVAKGQVVADKPTAGDKAEAENLLDVDDDRSNAGSTSRHMSTDEGQQDGKPKVKSSLSLYGASPKSRSAFMRRQSSIIGSTNGHGGTNRGHTPEMREQLKHLGPSNLASRPKTTRYGTVKIKPGAGKLIDAVVSGDDHAQTSESATIQDHESAGQDPSNAGVGSPLEPLLSAGGKDGVHAVQTGYGSMTPTTPPKTAKNNVGVQVGEDSTEPSESRETSRMRPASGRPRQPQREGSAESRDTLGSFQGRTRQRSPSAIGKGARSGSITENVINAGGVRKVVLEMTSSSGSGDEEEEEAAKNGGVTVTGDSNNADDKDTADADKGSKSQRKKRSKGKKQKEGTKGGNGGKDPDDTTPLLERDS